MLKDTGDKLTAAGQERIEAAMADLRKAIEGNDTPGMTAGMEKLMAAQHRAAEALYKAQAAAGAARG